MNKNTLHQVILQADEYYAGRSNLSQVTMSVDLLQNAAVESYEISWRLSRACFFLGQESQDESQREAVVFHKRGAEAGRHAVELDGNGVQGHFWLGVNLALLAQVERPVSALVHALKARRALRRAVMIDPTYHDAGPLRALARLQHKLPRWLGGSSAKACANFERAISFAPNNTVTRMYLAELLVEAGEVTRARDELERILNVQPDPNWAFEIERDQRLAKEMIGKLS